MKNFDFRIILLGILVLLTISLTSCSMEESVEPVLECKNFDIETIDYHHIKLLIHSTNPSVEVCREVISADGENYGWECKTIVARYYNCYEIRGTEGIAQLNITVDGCEEKAW